MQFTNAQVESLMTKVPAMRQRAVELLAAELSDSKKLSGRKSGRKSAKQPKQVQTQAKSKRVPRGQHHKMAIEVLDALNATSTDTGVVSKELRAKGKELGHDFGPGMNAVFDTLAKKKLVKYKAVSNKDAKKPRYKWWLVKSKAEALEALAPTVKETVAE